jgi:hypothetical protein
MPGNNPIFLMVQTLKNHLHGKLELPGNGHRNHKITFQNLIATTTDRDHAIVKLAITG